MNRVRAAIASLLLLVGACRRERPEARAREVSQVRQASCLQFDVPDSLLSPDSTLELRISSADAGRVSVRVLNRRTKRTLFSGTDDLVNVRWLPDNRGFVYAASPIYATPGVFVVELATGSKRGIVSPSNLSDSAYPDGADVFIVCDVRSEPDGKTLVDYLRFPHIDSVDLRVRPLSGPVRQVRF